MKEERIRSNVGMLIPDQEFPIESPEVQEVATRISIKKLKFMAEMSEETLCFVCQVYIDGKHIGQASNEGHGGATYLHVNRDSRELAQPIEETLKGLTRKIFTYPDSDREDSRWAWNLEDLIDDIVGEEIEEKENKKWLTKTSRTCILFKLEGMEKGEYKSYKRQAKVSDKVNCEKEEGHLFNLIKLNHKDVIEICGFRTREDWKKPEFDEEAAEAHAERAFETREA